MIAQKVPARSSLGEVTSRRVLLLSKKPLGAGEASRECIFEADDIGRQRILASRDLAGSCPEVWGLACERRMA